MAVTLHYVTLRDVTATDIRIERRVSWNIILDIQRRKEMDVGSATKWLSSVILTEIGSATYN